MGAYGRKNNDIALTYGHGQRRRRLSIVNHFHQSSTTGLCHKETNESERNFGCATHMYFTIWISSFGAGRLEINQMTKHRTENGNAF